MADTSQTKSEAASPKKREDARKRGQVAASQDLSTGLTLLFMLMLFSYVSPTLGNALLHLFQADLPTAVLQAELSVSDTVDLGRASSMFLVATSAVLLFGASVIGISAYVVQVGFNVSADALSIKTSRLSPMSGVKKIFSLRGMVRTGSALTKFTVVTATTIAVCYTRGTTLGVVGKDLATGVVVVWDFCLLAGMMSALSVVVIGAADFAFQRWQHEEDLRMTLQELKEESKETEGDPQVKARIRKLQSEAAKLRSLNEVPNADVVITNPTHYSVAIQYERNAMSAPRVVAKGTDLMAKRIKRRAKEAGVPIVERKSIARALYASTEVGGEIPATLYRAVAEILAQIYRLKR